MMAHLNRLIISRQTKCGQFFETEYVPFTKQVLARNEPLTFAVQGVIVTLPHVPEKLRKPNGLKTKLIK